MLNLYENHPDVVSAGTEVPVTEYTRGINANSVAPSISPLVLA